MTPLVFLVVGIVLAGLALIAALGFYGAHVMMRSLRNSSAETPQSRGLPEPHLAEFRSADGHALTAWWFESPSASAAVLVAHGFGGDKVSSLWVAEGLYPDFNVLLLDLRAHGESAGTRTSIGVLERLDILAAIAWVRQVTSAPIALWGMSMGAAASILAAAECPEVQAVVADSPYARLRTPVRTTICRLGYPARIAPALARLVCHTARWRLRSAGFPWIDPVDVVHRIAPRPLLLIHGGDDRLIPAAESLALRARAGDSCQVWIEPAVVHASTALAAPELYRTTVRNFLDRAFHQVALPAR